MLAVLLSGGLALLLSLVGTRYAIRVLSAKGYGQEIREDGPTTHHTKRGTPTMGGIVIILATVVSYLIAKLVTGELPTASALLLLFLFVGLGTVGFLDDFIKIYKQRNLGLRSKAKMIGQTVVAVVFGGLAISPWLADDRGQTPASKHISFIRDFEGWTLWTPLVLVLIWLIVTGMSNAVNLTDGLDGLAGGASIIVFGAFTLMNIWQNNQWCGQANITYGKCYEVRDPLDLAIVSAAITGACFGFLWWNASPARIFMGDTGSLALGGAVAGLAILTRTELLLGLIGGLFVMVTLSVMLQVTFFKASKKSALFRKVFRVEPGARLFRMAPIHHHFEMLGWDQVTIVIRFWIITGLLVATGMGLFYAEWVTGA
jgi:phospho-N-acetylmuramoyl-pentapeptide-transferase